MAAETHSEADLTPAERRRRKVRDSIIDAAEAIFAEEGEAGLSMRRIAERIDYSPAALYKYFDSKEALFREIREQFFERLLERMQQVCMDIEDGPLLCTKCMRAYVETGLEQPSHYKLAFGGAWEEEKPEEGSFGYAAAEHLHEMIAQSMEAGWFRQADLGLAANSVWAASHGLTMLAVTIPNFPKESASSWEEKSDPDALNLDAMIAFHAEMVMRGLGSDRLIERLNAGLKV
ncbi:MAG: TetR/AcrR family transcriptional regulator [Oceanicaulis sp.]